MKLRTSVQREGGMEAAPVRVLVADDDADAAAALAELLQTLDCVVQVAHTGKEVIELAPEFTPDVVILDIEMPEVDGVQAARTLKQQAWSGAALFVAYTAAQGQRIAKRINECGFHRYFIKPTPFERFAALIESVRTRGPHSPA